MQLELGQGEAFFLGVTVGLLLMFGIFTLFPPVV